MTTEILKMMDQRKASKQVKRGTKNLIGISKGNTMKKRKKWFNSKYEKIKALENKDVRNMHQEIREVIGKKCYTSSECIYRKDRSMTLEQVDILDRWTEYLEDLFDDERGDKPVIRKELEGPSIIKYSLLFKT